MTAYNREQYIGEAIESVLHSSFLDFELVILDDCSTDRTFSIAASYASADNRIRLFRNANNLGQFKNRNQIVNYARGKYLKYLDSDDRLAPGALEAIMEIMLSYPSAELGSKGGGESGIVLSNRDSYLAHFFDGKHYLHQGPSATIFTKRLFEKVGGFPEDGGILADTQFMLKAAAISPLVTLPENIVFWRVHEGQVTVGQRDEYAMLLERDYILKSTLSLPECPLTEDEKIRVIKNSQKRFLQKLPERILKIRSWSKIRHLLRVKQLTGTRVFQLVFQRSS